MFPLAAVLCLAWLTSSALALEIMWPTGPRVGDRPSVQWSGGVTPYVMNITNTNTSTVVYTYTGNDNVTYWDVNVVADTIIAFKITDATDLSVTSDPVTVLANALSVSVSQSSVSVARISSLSVSIASVSLASIASLSSISVTSATASPTSSSSAQPGSSISSASTPTSSSGSNNGNGGGGGSNHTGAIVGGVVGGILGLALLALLVLFLLRRRRYNALPTSQRSSDDGQTAMQQLGGAGAGAGAGAARYRDAPPSAAPTGTSTSDGHMFNAQQHAQPPVGAYQQQQQPYALQGVGYPAQGQPQPSITTGGDPQGGSETVYKDPFQQYHQPPAFPDNRRGWSGLPEV